MSFARNVIDIFLCEQDPDTTYPPDEFEVMNVEQKVSEISLDGDEKTFDGDNKKTR